MDGALDWLDELWGEPGARCEEAGGLRRGAREAGGDGVGLWHSGAPGKPGIPVAVPSPAATAATTACDDRVPNSRRDSEKGLGSGSGWG